MGTPRWKVARYLGAAVAEQLSPAFSLQLKGCFRVSANATTKIFSYQHLEFLLKLGANEASAQGLQNMIQNDCHTKYLIELLEFENR